MGPGRRQGGDLLIEVRVQPRASRTEFAGTIGERLRIRLQAPPVDGRANAALVDQTAAAAETLKGQAQHLVQAVRVFNLDGPGLSERLFVGRVQKQIAEGSTRKIASSWVIMPSAAISTAIFKAALAVRLPLRVWSM